MTSKKTSAFVSATFALPILSATMPALAVNPDGASASPAAAAPTRLSERDMDRVTAGADQHRREHFVEAGKDPLWITTLAIGEEGGGWQPCLAPCRIDKPIKPIKPIEPIIDPTAPIATTMALGEEGGGYW